MMAHQTPRRNVVQTCRERNNTSTTNNSVRTYCSTIIIIVCAYEYLTLESRIGEKILRIRLLSPHIGTAVLKGLSTS